MITWKNLHCFDRGLTPQEKNQRRKLSPFFRVCVMEQGLLWPGHKGTLLAPCPLESCDIFFETVGAPAFTFILTSLFWCPPMPVCGFLIPVLEFLDNVFPTMFPFVWRAFWESVFPECVKVGRRGMFPKGSLGLNTDSILSRFLTGGPSLLSFTFLTDCSEKSVDDFLFKPVLLLSKKKKPNAQKNHQTTDTCTIQTLTSKQTFIVHASQTGNHFDISDIR